MDEPTDQQLLARARAGDATAIEQLLERHQDQIYRFGMKMCRDPEDARDVLQDTLIAMARGVREFRGDASLATWLYTIARSFCLKKRRRSKFAPHHEQPLDTPAAANVPDPARGPAEELAGKQLDRAVEDAIAELEPMYRDVLVLRDVEGLSAPEVGEILGLSVQAVKSRLHRARVAVRAQLAPVLAGEPAAGPASQCPDVVAMYSQYLEDELSAATCAEMERHLEGCTRCRSACDSLKRSLALCRTSGASVKVPESVQKSVKIALRDFLATTA